MVFYYSECKDTIFFVIWRMIGIKKNKITLEVVLKFADNSASEI